MAFYRLVPRNGVTFTDVEAMLMIGIPEEFASMPTLKQGFNRILVVQNDADPLRSYADKSPEAKAARTAQIYKAAKYNPDGKTEKQLSAMMRLAGWSHDESQGGGAAYNRCRRAIKPRPVATQDSNSNGLPPAVVDTGDGPPALDSPLTVDHSQFRYPSGAATATTTTTSTTTASAASMPSKQAIYRSLLKASSVPLPRQSSAQAQDSRRVDLELVNTRKGAHKVATVLHHSVETGEVQLENLDSADKCAAAVNKMLGVEVDGELYDFVNARALKTAYAKGERGVSPP